MSDIGVCIVCGAHAEWLCDRILGWSTVIDETGHEPRLVKDKMLTCDAPMCDEHTHVEAHRHLCGEEGCNQETFDVCPNHVGGFNSGALLTENGAEALRARARIVLVP